MAEAYRPAASYAELCERLGPEVVQHVKALAAAAPPLPEEVIRTLRPIFAEGRRLAADAARPAA